MRIGDLVRLPLEALWQQKARTLLTTLGVVFGSFVLAASLSIGQGVQDTIRRLSGESDVLRTIRVTSQWRPSPSDTSSEETKIDGQMSDEKRDRLRRARRQYDSRFGRSGRRRLQLTLDRLAELRKIPHVVEVVPRYDRCGSGRAGRTPATIDNRFGSPATIPIAMRRLGRRASAQERRRAGGRSSASSSSISSG